MLIFTLQRETLGKQGYPTLGRLVSADAKFDCVTLERSVDGPHPCIPAGVYTLIAGIHHPGAPNAYRCPVIANVPGRSAIQIHIANRADQLLGCIAVGEDITPGGLAIDFSKPTFTRLMAFIGDGFPCRLIIENPA